MLFRFLCYGLIGWGLEIFWTGIHSLLQRDIELKGSSSLWMFPIYGSVILLEPVFRLLYAWPVVVRGGLYMLCIFAAEYASGWYIRTTAGVCPWDYSASRYQIQGLIRLDYAPVWFAVGILYEQVYWFFMGL